MIKYYKGNIPASVPTASKRTSDAVRIRRIRNAAQQYKLS